jgi:hypothetical protein
MQGYIESHPEITNLLDCTKVGQAFEVQMTINTTSMFEADRRRWKGK